VWSSSEYVVRERQGRLLREAEASRLVHRARAGRWPTPLRLNERVRWIGVVLRAARSAVTSGRTGQPATTSPSGLRLPPAAGDRA
jgi:hypothetical protein